MAFADTHVKAMEKHNCKNLVFSSSATVYGTPKTIPIPETSPLQPESAYGRTKAMVEQILKDVCVASAGKESKDAAFKGVSVRYFKWVDAVCYVYSPLFGELVAANWLWRRARADELSPAGAHPSGKLGEEPMGKPGNLLPLLAQMAVGRQKPDLKVFGDDYPTP